MIELKNLRKVFYEGSPYEKEAIKSINLRVNEGDFITIIGSNGSGKTTLFNLIAGTFLPTNGRIYVNDRDVTEQDEYKRACYIGRIYQNPLLGTASGMTVEENVALAMKKGLRGLAISLNKELREEIRDKLKLLGMNLENRLKEPVSLLSGGQRQALTLLMAILSKPLLLLLDEHTAALDPRNAKIVLDLTRRFIEENKLTALMVTHNMLQAIELGNRLLMMDEGEIILDVSGDEKKSLTVEKLVEKFHSIRRHSIESDEVLLVE